MAGSLWPAAVALAPVENAKRMPAQLWSDHKEAIKALKGERKEADREYKNIKKRITANEKALKKNPELNYYLWKNQSRKKIAPRLLSKVGRLLSRMHQNPNLGIFRFLI
jgi:hypothetical protein